PAVGSRRDPDTAGGQAETGARVRGWQSRYISEQDPTATRQRCADRQYARIDRRLERADREACGKRADQGGEGARQEQPKHRTAAAEDETLGEQRPPQRAPGGAQ